MTWTLPSAISAVGLCCVAVGVIGGIATLDPFKPHGSRLRMIRDADPGPPVDEVEKQRAALEALLPDIERDVAVCDHFLNHDGRPPSEGRVVARFDIDAHGGLTTVKVDGTPHYTFADCAWQALERWDLPKGPDSALLEVPVLRRRGLKCLPDPKIDPIMVTGPRQVPVGALGGDAFVDRMRLIFAEHEPMLERCYRRYRPAESDDVIALTASAFGVLSAVNLEGPLIQPELLDCVQREIREWKLPKFDYGYVVRIPIIECH